jgi:hypothetical protein
VSRRASQWLLWAVLACTVPLPYYAGDTELAPPVRAAFLSSLYLGILLTEGAVGTTVMIARSAGLTALAYLVGLFVVAALLARLLGGLRPGARTAVVGALVAALLGASLLEIYSTPLSSSRLRSNLLHVFR